MIKGGAWPLPCQEYKADGFHPANVSVVSVSGARSQSALWDATGVGGWKLKSQSPAANYAWSWS